jgi:hypothetical protein
MTYEQAFDHVNNLRPITPHSGLKDSIYRLYPRPWSMPQRPPLPNLSATHSDQSVSADPTTCRSERIASDRKAVAETAPANVPYLFSPYIFCAELAKVYSSDSVMAEQDEAPDVSAIRESGPYLYDQYIHNSWPDENEICNKPSDKSVDDGGEQHRGCEGRLESASDAVDEAGATNLTDEGLPDAEQGQASTPENVGEPASFEQRKQPQLQTLT